MKTKKVSQDTGILEKKRLIDLSFALPSMSVPIVLATALCLEIKRRETVQYFTSS